MNDLSDKTSAPPYSEDLAPSNPALLHNLNIRLGNQIYGHERSRLKTFVVALSSKTLYTLAEILVGDPGAAKNTICKVVLANFDNVLEITSASAKALDYLPEDSLKDKILYVEETVGVKDSGLALRSLLSEGVLSRLVTVKDKDTNKPRTELFKSKAKPVFLSTTNQVTSAGGALANRILHEDVDQSREQIRGGLKWLAKVASMPHNDDPQPDPYLKEFLQNSIVSKEVLVTFLDPIVEKLPDKKTHIFRRYRQLEYLIKISALIHWRQRVRVILNDKDYIVAHPIDFQYAVDLLGPGGIRGRVDWRLDQVLKWMQPDTAYNTKDVATAFDKTMDWARKILNELANLTKVSKNENTNPYLYTKLEETTEDDPLQSKYLEGYGYDGLLFKKWLEESGAIIDYIPEREPVYVNPLSANMPLRRSTIQAQIEPTLPESVESQPTLATSVVVGLKQLADEADRDLLVPRDLALLRESIKEEMDRVGYAQDAILRYRAKDKSQGRIDDVRYSKLLKALADKGELQPFGADCWRLPTK